MEESQQVPNQKPITPVPPIATYPTPQPAPTSKTPWMLISLIVILFGVASYFGYQNYQLKQQMTAQTPTPTPATTVANSPTPTVSSESDEIQGVKWKSYTNNEYKFEITHLTDSKIRVSQPPSNDRMFTVGFDSPNAVFDHLFISGGYSFEISIQTHDNFSNISEYLEFQKEHSMYKRVTQKTVNNVNGYLFSLDDSLPLTNVSYSGYVAEHNGLYYTVNYFTDVDQKIFDQMLSSFKFTN